MPKLAASCFLVLILCLYCIGSSLAANVYDQLSMEPNLSKFKEMVDRDEVMKVYLKNKLSTTFAPTNAALDKLLSKNLPQDVLRKLASYHIVGVVVKKDVFPYSVSSALQEAAPLYLSFKERRPVSHHEYLINNDPKEYFVNNAKIIKESSHRSNINEDQLLYTIDETLEPYIPSDSIPPFALGLISTPSVYGIDERWDSFYQKIVNNGQQSIFERPGNHTFFVPTKDIKPEIFDKYVVLGHVIPNNVLFLNVMGKESYRSAANDATVNVELSLLNRTLRINPEQTYYVQSNTIKADPKHNKGIVMSRVLRANIPVKNGVIHLIEKPLMIIDTSIIDFLTQENDGRLKTFNELLDRVPDLRAEIARGDQKTVLAPTDSAFNNLNEDEKDNKVQYLIQNPDQLRELLQLHYIPQNAVSTDDIRRGTKPEVMSGDNRRSLYFRVAGTDTTTRLTVEGGGVNATAVQADIGATNGIIHIIDRVLGMPFQNIYDKLRGDENLKFTYSLGEGPGTQKWNEQLLREDRRFTYFVPSNEAWDAFQRDNPSEYKQLEMKLFPANIRNVLDRHLVVNQQISSNQLDLLDTIHTVKGILKVSKGSGGLGNVYIEWENIRARVIRPDVQAINGVIHVIDQVLMKKRDLSVNSSTHPMVSPAVNMTLAIIFIIIAKFY